MPLCLLPHEAFPQLFYLTQSQNDDRVCELKAVWPKTLVQDISRIYAARTDLPSYFLGASLWNIPVRWTSSSYPCHCSSRAAVRQRRTLVVPRRNLHSSVSLSVVAAVPDFHFQNQQRLLRTHSFLAAPIDDCVPDCCLPLSCSHPPPTHHSRKCQRVAARMRR